MGMNFNNGVFWIMCVPGIVIGTVSITFEPSKPPLTDAVDISCKLTDSGSTSVTWNIDTTPTSCGSGFCVPIPSSHNFSMSGNVFHLLDSSVTIDDCISYSCADANVATDITSKDLFVAYFDKNDITTTEPGANTDGSISVTTGCVLSALDLTITWYKIENGETDFTADRPYPVDSTERSTCSRTCHSEEDKKVTSGFTHTEYTGSNFVEVEYKVTISHSSYTDPFTWTSAKYKIEVQDFCTCPLWDCKCEKSSGECIWCWILFILLILLAASTSGVFIGCCITTCKGRLNCEAADCSECCQRLDNNIIRCKCCCSCWNIENAPFWYYILWWTVIGTPVAFGIFIVMKLKPNAKPEKKNPEEQPMRDIKTDD